jgi:signal transduction histidine kinase
MVGSLAQHYHGLSLRARIMALVIACFLPAWLYVAYLTLESYQRQRAALDETLLATTRSLLSAFEAVIGADEAGIQVLALSSLLDVGDFAGFHARASAVLRQTHGLNIVLLGSDGHQIVNTLTPYGEKLPVQPPGYFNRVVTTGQTILSDLHLGRVAQQPLVALAVPIFRDHRLTHVLDLSLESKSFAPVLNQKGRPDAWVAGIFDTTGTIVARSHSPEKYVGTKGIQAVLDSLHGPPEGITETNILEGTSVVLAYSRSEHYGWTAVIAVPKAILEAEIRRSLWVSLITGAMVLLAGLVLARKLAGGIAAPIRNLIPAAAAIGDGRTVTIAPLNLKEAEEVRRALVAAADLISVRTQERDIARTNELEISQQHRVLRALSDIAALPNASAQEQLCQTLALGRRHLGLDIGIIGRIEGDTYTVLHHDGELGMPLADGQTFELGQTYCTFTLNADDVVAVAFMGQSVYAGHPCYQRSRLETYIGSPLQIRGERFGTVSFSSPAPRDHEFDPGDIDFMRLLCRWIGSVIERDLANRDIVGAKDAAEAAQANLAIHAHRLAQSNADLEQFAYVASHDLRTPLRNIVSYAQLLERRYKGTINDDADDFIGFIVDNSKKMTKLISDLLEYSRASRQNDQLEPVSAMTAIAQALTNLKADLDLGNTEIKFGELPVVMGVETYLVSLFQNLIGNAIKYRRQEHALHVQVSAERMSAEFWRFAVADNGIGIGPEYHSKIFEIFQRLAPQEETEGTGIGLTLCRCIVGRFGGTIWVESEPGEGATFFFTLRDGT